MVSVKREYVFVAAILLGVGALISIISLATEQWVVTETGQWNQLSYTSAITVKYGLFQGYYQQTEPGPLSLQILMTCLIPENVCAVLCGIDADARYSLLRELYNGNINANETDCPASSQRAISYFNPSFLGNTFSTMSNTEEMKFINCGLWISTVFFLILSISLGVASSALSIWNSVSNPVQQIFGIFGLFIFNAAALFSILLTVILWGAMHLSVTYYNVATYYTLMGIQSTNGRAGLGFSYWLNLISIFLYIGSIVVLYVREYILARDPALKVVERDEHADPGLYMF